MLKTVHAPAPDRPVRSTTAPAGPRPLAALAPASLLRTGLGVRLVIAGSLVAALWAAVLWAVR